MSGHPDLQDRGPTPLVLAVGVLALLSLVVRPTSGLTLALCGAGLTLLLVAFLLLERRYRSLQSLNRTLIETIPLGFLAVDSCGTVRYANPAFSMMTGMARQDVVGKNFEELFREGPLNVLVTRTATLGKGVVEEFDATDVPVGSSSKNFSIKAVRGSDGLLACLIEDLGSKMTAEKAESQYREQLVRNERLSSLGGLVSGVAHELNNPLSIVIGYTELLSRRTRAPTLIEKALDDMRKAALRCQKIVSGLLSLSRQQAPERKLVCVSDLLEEAVLLRSYQFKVRNIEVERDYQAVPHTVADTHQLLQAFFNLINNAYQALQDHEGPRVVRVSCSADDRFIRVTIADTGPGIPDEIRNRVFEPFFTTKPVGVGTGLGLSISRGTLRSHGGDVQVAGEPGKGAVFVCTIPITIKTNLDACLPGTLPSREKLAGKRVLVVDDEEGILDFCRSYLQNYELIVDYCINGAEALEMITRQSYDLILLDLRMPQMGGRELFAKLREQLPDQAAKVCFMTGDSADDVTRKFLKSSGHRCLFKPFALDGLDEVLVGLHSRADKD